MQGHLMENKMQNLYVRVNPKTGLTQFNRCAILFTLVWALVEVDAATADRLREEQMLETSDTQPDGYVPPAEIKVIVTAESQTPSNAAASDAGAGNNTVIPPPVLSDAEKLAAIKEAMTALDKTVEGNWTKGGLPNATVLTATLGFDVSATQRDEVWAVLQQENAAVDAAANQTGAQ
jgi:hypothetical protein